MAAVPMSIRPPVMAGRFYHADPRQCAADARRLARYDGGVTLPAVLHGALVPHAGWVCSGRIAGQTLAALAGRTMARTLILTGSVHTLDLDFPALDRADAWRSPAGDMPVDADLRAALAALPGFRALDDAHRLEHSLEVQLPLIDASFGAGVKIVPVMIPPHADAPEWGRAIGRVMRDWRQPLAIIVSSDLTHYGPNYGYCPAGLGEAGRRWASEVNDARLLRLIVAMDADRIVQETQAHQNACGGGAIAAAVAACREMGCARGWLLEHTDSTRELTPIGHADAHNSVGYAGVVFG
jgi:hypothetical protein